MPTPEYHARLGASSAHRWLNCPASVSLCDGVEKTTSEHAEAGRLAHSIAELKGRKRFTVMAKRTYTSQLKKLQEDKRYHPEMDGYTNLYIDVLNEHAMSFSTMPFVAFETPVPLSYTTERKADGSPATGTADNIMIGDGVLWITDYKNGSGVPVDAVKNPQMMIYALGALELYAPIYGDTIQTIKMTIVQPALKSILDWEISRADLLAWSTAELYPVAKTAEAGDGEPAAGAWCRFCPVCSACRTRAAAALADESYEKKLPPLLSDAEVGDALTRGAELVAWYNELKDYALQACLDGKDIPGYKAVEGRGMRAWIDTDAAIKQLIADGVDEALLYERRPITAPAAEKALGSSVYMDLCAPLVAKQPGKPTLVPASDKRPAYNAAAAAFAPVVSP